MQKRLKYVIIMAFLVIITGCSNTEKVVKSIENVENQENTVTNYGVETGDLIDQCRDLCGDGYCNEFRCLDEGDECNSRTNSCPEDEFVCPSDC